MIHYQVCPVCGGKNIDYIFDVKDFTVSGNQFAIWECSDCSLRFTQDVPDAGEIGAFYKSENYISHSETRKGFINAAYLTVRKFTLSQKKKLVSKKTGLHKGKILDIGCGTGAFLEVMKQAGWQVQGLEPDDGARKIALQRGVPAAPSKELYKLDELFDAITMWHVLEHVHELHPYLEKIQSLLKPDGVALVAVPNYTSGDAMNYQSVWAAYDVPRHLYHFSPTSMKKLMLLHQMDILEIAPMWFDSFYVSMLSENYSKGSNNILSACWQGLKSNIGAVRNTAKCSSVIYIIKKSRY